MTKTFKEEAEAILIGLMEITAGRTKRLEPLNEIHLITESLEALQQLHEAEVAEAKKRQLQDCIYIVNMQLGGSKDVGVAETLRIFNGYIAQLQPPETAKEEKG